MTYSARLRAILGPVTPDLARAAALMWRTEPILDTYLAWLRTSHAMLRATCPLLVEAADRSAEPLASYFWRNAEDELGHVEWIVADYRLAGGDPQDLDDQIPSSAVARLVGAQYYWIRHVDPVALLGHIAVLEWHPPHPDLAPSLAERTGLPLDAFRTLGGHAASDPHHARHLTDVLDRVPFTPRQHQLIARSALATVDGLTALVAPRPPPARQPAPQPALQPPPTRRTPWPASTACSSSDSTSRKPATSNSPH